MNDIGGSGDGDSNWFSAESTTRDSSYFSGLLAAIKAGLRDLRRLPVLVLSTAIVVLIATLSVLASPILRLLTDAADAYVTKNSELIVVIEPGPHVDRVVDQIAEMAGVSSVVHSTEEDLEAVGSGFLERGDSYTIRLDGLVDVALLQPRLTSTFPEVAAARQTVGLESDLAVELLGMLIPWLAGGLIVAGLLMIAYLAMMVGRIRAGESEIMGLIGSTPLQTWLRLGMVTLVPTRVRDLVGVGQHRDPGALGSRPGLALRDSDARDKPGAPQTDRVSPTRRDSRVCPCWPLGNESQPQLVLW